MRRPKMPPEFHKLFDKADKENRLPAILLSAIGPLVGGVYLHWDKLRYHTPPEGLSHEEWWLGLKLQRSQKNIVPLKSGAGQSFSYMLVTPIPERLHHIDMGAGGIIRSPDNVLNRDTRDRYYVRSLIEEAITSSQLEGAVTTRMVAKEMIRSGRKPRDRSERMILNNFNTMRRLEQLKTEPLTTELVLEIHRLISENTLDDPATAGRFRRAEERVVVSDMYGEVYHEPPPADQLAERMKAMCDFANGKTPSDFMHPVLRAILLHFWLAYDHPFVDGNGRTARALFYWSMLHQDYWLCEFISISPLILKSPSEYQLAFLHTETDENDLTYFILYHLNLIQKAVAQLHDYIDRKTRKLQEMEGELRGMAFLNHRQRMLIAHALRHPNQIYTVESHRLSHNVVYETARRDLCDLANRGLLLAKKHGKTWHFTPAVDLESRILKLS